MEFPFDFDRQTTAFILEFRGYSVNTVDLSHNDRFSSWIGVPPTTNYDPDDSREPKPVVTGDESEGYLVIPFSKELEKDGLRFGRLESRVDVQLPQSPNGGVSDLHFRVYLSKSMTWMLKSLSRNKTSLNGEEMPRGTHLALHPEQPNKIRVQDVQFFIHVPSQNITCSPNYGILSPARQGPRSRSSVHKSATGASSIESLAPQSLEGTRGYHLCRTRPIAPYHKPKYEAICIRTGHHCVAKLYPESRARNGRLQYDDLYIVSNKSSHIVSYLKYFVEDNVPTIITEYVDGVTLQQWMEQRTLRPASVYLMYRQQIDALAYLEEAALIHRGISPATILVSSSAWGEVRMTKLTGFSSYVECKKAEAMDDPSYYNAPEICRPSYSTASDIFSLSRVIYDCLLPTESRQTSKSTPPLPDSETATSLAGDPEVLKMVLQGLSPQPNQRELASQIRERMMELMGSSLESPFRSFEVTRTRWIVCSIEGEKCWVRSSEFLDAIYTQQRVLSLDIPNFLGSQKTINGDKYCLKRAAQKLCRKFGLNDMGDHLRTNLRAGKSTLEEIEQYRVFYHSPSMMINISQVLKIAGREATQACFKNFSPINLQEVYGVSAWEGTFIDLDTFKRIASFLSANYGCSFKELFYQPNDILAKRFSTTEREYITLVTQLFNPNMLRLRRSDCYADWTPFSTGTSELVDLGESLSRCDQLGLPELKRAFEKLDQQQREIPWPGEDADISLDYDSATTINTTDSFLEEEQANDSSEEGATRVRFGV